MFGLLCGITTIPVGCLISGLLIRCPLPALLLDIVPLTLFSVFIAFSLYRFPRAAVLVFKSFGRIVSAVIYAGLALGTFEAMTGITLIERLNPIGDGISVVASAVFILSGALPMLFLLQKVLKKPLTLLGKRFGINAVSALSLIGTLATSTTTFAVFSDMNRKGRVLNSAFSVSAAFVLADHIAFTMAFRKEYLPALVVGKIISGLSAMLVSGLLYDRFYGKKGLEEEPAV